MAMAIALLSLVLVISGFVCIYYAVLNFRIQKNAKNYDQCHLIAQESGIFVEQGMAFNKAGNLEVKKKVSLGFLRSLIAR